MPSTLLFPSIEGRRLLETMLAIRLKNEVKAKIRAAQMSYEQSLLRKFPKAFYSYVKSKQKVKPSIGPLEKCDGSFTTNDSEVAGNFNRYFESTFTQEDSSNIPVPTFGCEEHISKIDITESVALQKLCALEDNKASGPDGLHSYILKSCAHTLCSPLTMLFRQSLSSGNLPNEWKQVNVVPVLKKGSRHKANNYRLISLTSTILKILESFIRTDLLTHLIENNILKHQQHGFVGRKSCLTNVLVTFETGHML